MDCLDVVIKFRGALLDDGSDDRYCVRRSVIEKCDEIISEFNQDIDHHYKISYLYEWIYSESKSCSDSGHSASIFYDQCLDLLQITRGLSAKDTLNSVCCEIIEHKAKFLDPELSKLLEKLSTFFD